jgi:hypothetical protein
MQSKHKLTGPSLVPGKAKPRNGDTNTFADRLHSYTTPHDEGLDYHRPRRRGEAGYQSVDAGAAGPEAAAAPGAGAVADPRGADEHGAAAAALLPPLLSPPFPAVVVDAG